MFAVLFVLLPLAACQVGGPMTVDVSRVDVQQIASFALGQLNTLLRTQNSLVKIVSAKTQVVSGINYFLTLQLQKDNDIQTCNVTVWSRPWTNDKQVTNHHCQMSTKREAMIPGGAMYIDVHRSDVQEMAGFALSELSKLTGAVNTQTEIISAKTQVVSGINYILSLRTTSGTNSQICDVTVWYQAWTGSRKLTRHVCRPTTVTKRQIGMPGTMVPIDVHSDEVQKMASFALSEINGLQSAKNVLNQVVSAQKQTVAGVRYALKLELQSNGQTQYCDVTVWYQSWTNTKQLLNHHCSANSPKRSILLGGVQPASLSEPVQKAVSFAEDALNAKTNSMFRMVTQTVDHISRQLVAGMKYNFNVNLITSSCANNNSNNGKSITDCPVNTNSVQHQTCTVSVLYQAWTKPQYTLLSDTCSQLS